MVVVAAVICGGDVGWWLSWLVGVLVLIGEGSGGWW